MKKILPAFFLLAIHNLVAAQLVIQNGATLTTANGALVTLQNIDLQNEGTINQQSGNGRFLFTGNLDNTISGNSNPLFDIVEVSKTGAAKLLLAQNISIGSQLLFSSGSVNLKNNTIFLAPAAVVSGETEANRLMDDPLNAGQIIIQPTLAASPGINPGNIGVEINTTSGAPGNTTITRYCGVVTHNGSSSGLIQRYYKIEPTSNNGLNASAKFYYLNSELNGVDAATAVLWKSTDNGISWSAINPDARSTTLKYLQKDGINDFSLWTIGAFNSVLPVVLSSFNTACTGNGANLQWTTQTELNAGYFIIERSIDGIQWTDVTHINANGTPSDYHFKDAFSGFAYYRLKEVDQDGRSTYSSTVQSNCGLQNVTVLLYPDPTHDYSNLVFYSNKELRSAVSIYDASGKLAKRIAIDIAPGNNTIRINFSGLARGVYTVILQEKGLDIKKQVILN